MTRDVESIETFAAAAEAVPAGEGWLGPRERAVQAGLRFPKRRDDWRLGRWVAKHAVRAALARRGRRSPALEAIEILAAADGAPKAFVGGEPIAFAVSLSHSAGVGFCVVAEGGADPGCDVERIEPRDPAFVADYFAPEEARLVEACPADERPFLATLVWSAKESALKALREGLRRDTRSVRVRRIDEAPGETGWSGLRVECVETARVFSGSWRRTRSEVFTVVR